MKYLFKNIKSFFEKEKGMMLLIVLCSFVASLIIFFSFGLIRHFAEQKRVGESESYELSIVYKELFEAKEAQNPDYLKIADSLDTLNVKEFRDLIFNLDDYVFANSTAISSSMTYNDDYCVVEFDENGGMAIKSLYNIRLNFCYDPATNLTTMTNGQSKTFNPYLSNMMVDGIGLSQEDFLYGNPNAVVGQGLFNDLYVDGKGMINGYLNNEYSGEFSSIANPVVNIGGNDFTVCGITNNEQIEVPISALADDTELKTVPFILATISYELPVTHEQYTRAKNLIDTEYSGRLAVREIEFVQKNTEYYNAIIAVIVIIVLISALNIAVIFRYILLKRQKQIAVFKLSGCSNQKIALLFVLEAFLLTLPIFVIGSLLYLFIIKDALSDIFIYLPLAYTPNVIFMAFALYILLSVIVLSHMITRLIKHTPVTILKGD